MGAARRGYRTRVGAADRSSYPPSARRLLAGPLATDRHQRSRWPGVSGKPHKPARPSFRLSQRSSEGPLAGRN